MKSSERNTIIREVIMELQDALIQSKEKSEENTPELKYQLAYQLGYLSQAVRSVVSQLEQIK
jgi:hypothetical protein